MLYQVFLCVLTHSTGLDVLIVLTTLALILGLLSQENPKDNEVQELSPDLMPSSKRQCKLWFGVSHKHHPCKQFHITSTQFLSRWSQPLPLLFTLENSKYLYNPIENNVALGMTWATSYVLTIQPSFRRNLQSPKDNED